MAREIRASHQEIKYTNTQKVNRSVEESKSEMLGKQNPVEMVCDVCNVTRGCSIEKSHTDGKRPGGLCLIKRERERERQAVKKPERVAAKNTKRTSYPVRMLRWAASRRGRESRRPNEAKSTTQNKWIAGQRQSQHGVGRESMEGKAEREKRGAHDAYVPGALSQISPACEDGICRYRWQDALASMVGLGGS